MRRWAPAAVLAGFGLMGFVAAGAIAGPGDGFTPGSTVGPGDHVPICHALGNGGFNAIAPSAGVVFGHAGSSHQDGSDIIPPFTFDPNGAKKDLDTSLAGGQNWVSGQATWAAGCVVPGSTATPTDTTPTTPTDTTPTTPTDTTPTTPTDTTPTTPTTPTTTATPTDTTPTTPTTTTTTPPTTVTTLPATTTEPPPATTETGPFTPPPPPTETSPPKATPGPKPVAKPAPAKRAEGVFLPPSLAYTP